MASPADHLARHLRQGNLAGQRHQVRQRWHKTRADHNGDTIAAALTLVRTLGADEADRVTADLARVNAVSRSQPRTAPRRRGAGRPRAVARSSSRGGDSGDSSDDPEPGPQGSGRRLDGRADTERWRVERKAALDRVVAGLSQ